MEDKTQETKNLAHTFNLSRKSQHKNHKIPFHTCQIFLKNKQYNYIKAENMEKLKFSHAPGEYTEVFT